MGTFNWPIRLDSMDGQRSLELEALVDTGASYTVVPADRLAQLGVTSAGRIEFELADGRPVEYDTGEARATVDGRSVTTLVVSGDNGGITLLGAYTLEGLRLAVDPVNSKLIPAPVARA